MFNFASRGEWYACQNMCPHKREFVLSRGIIGDQGGIPKVACPLHKKTFSLESGTCLSGENYQVQVFPVKVEADDVYLDLPAEAELEELLRPRTPCVRPVCVNGGGEASDSSTTSTRSPMSMNLRDFRRAGHTPTLFSAFLYFDISFMVWVLLGALANSIVPEFGLSDSQKGLMVAVPLLGGAMLRLVLGVLTDHIGARRTGILGMALTVIPLLLGWLWADSFSKVLLVGLLLGVAGASFAAALPLASRWYPPQYQGLAMGIAGAGNSGTALATFFGPRLAQAWGWHAVFGLALVPLLLTLVVFVIFAKDSPEQPAPKPLAAYAEVLRHARHLVVLPVLRGHVRRLRGAGQLPERLLPQPVRADARSRRATSPRSASSPARSCGRWAATWPIASAASGC